MRHPIPLVSLLVAVSAAGVASPVLAERPDVVRSATHTLRQAIGDELWTAPGEARVAGELPCADTPVGPPPDPGVGDSWDWYIWSLDGPPEATLRSCTVRGMSEHAYVVVEDSQWNVSVNQSQVDAILDAFENTSIGPYPDQGIYDLNTAWFGDPPDTLDDDPRVYILYYDFDVSSDGFFWAFDQQCDDVAAYHSNECDVVYMNSSDHDVAGPYLLAVLAHEFEHLIHYNYDPSEAAWVDEGIAELAMWLYGNPDNIVGFPANPDRTLTNFTGAFADYIKTYLWMLYLSEHYGGLPTMRALVAEPLDGIAGHDAVLADQGYTERFDDIFRDWVVANYLDDETIGDGRFGYAGETLPAFNPIATWSTYPVGPASASVSHWAGEYVRYLEATDLLATFDGADTGGFSVRALLLDDVNPTEVVDMSLDALQAGALSLPELGTTHDEAVLVHANVQGGGGTTYTYGAEADVVGVDGAPGRPDVLAATAWTSGAELRVRLSVPDGLDGADLVLELFDVHGRRVGPARSVDAGTGTRTLALPLDGGDTGSIPAGRVFVRVRSGRHVAATPVTIVR